MTDNTTDETTPADTEIEVSDSPSPTPEEPEAEPDTFSRDYVEELRQENGKYRQRAAKADELAQRLHTELVSATGKLADPTDLTFSEDHLDDADKLAEDIEMLLSNKPHLASRRPVGAIGQGSSPAAASVDLAAILRGSAG